MALHFSCLSCFFAVLITASVKVQSYKFNTDISATLEANDTILTLAIFEKLNWMINQTQKINRQLVDLNERILKQEETVISNTVALKGEIRDLLQQQNLNITKLFMRIYVDALNSFQLQHISVNNSSYDGSGSKLLSAIPSERNYKWQTILRRQDGSVNFNRSWHDYKAGFGHVEGEMFIGLEALHAMTTYDKSKELLIILQDFDNNTRFAKYNNFVIGNETENYKIQSVGQYSGDAGDSLSHHVQYDFATYDSPVSMCARFYGGGWWFVDCYCGFLTGPYFNHPNRQGPQGIHWNDWLGRNYSLKYAEMLLK